MLVSSKEYGSNQLWKVKSYNAAAAIAIVLLVQSGPLGIGITAILA